MVVRRTVLLLFFTLLRAENSLPCSHTLEPVLLPYPPDGNWLRQPGAWNILTVLCLPYLGTGPPLLLLLLLMTGWGNQQQETFTQLFVYFGTSSPLLLLLLLLVTGWGNQDQEAFNCCLFTLKPVLFSSSSSWWLAEATRSKKHLTVICLPWNQFSTLILLLVTWWGNQEQETF